MGCGIKKVAKMVFPGEYGCRCQQVAFCLIHVHVLSNTSHMHTEILHCRLSRGATSAFRTTEKAGRLSLPIEVHLWRRRPLCSLQSIASVTITAAEDQMLGLGSLHSGFACADKQILISAHMIISLAEKLEPHGRSLVHTCIF